MAGNPTARPGVANEVIAQSADMRFTLYTIDAGAQIPWHFHSEVSDWYICREGVFSVETQSPDHVETLSVGAMFQVPVRRVHRVVNQGDSPCRFALVQGLGAYDFNPVDG
ncbi:MAG: cupin domain-containing protein [Alphaproteobacteria bacterium]|nr:cupin domain-containing protein [Alphaproteobacteria bacterium]